MSTTMTEGAVDVLEALDFEPLCEVGRGKPGRGKPGPRPPCATAAQWVLHIADPPCEHQGSTLWCEHHRLLLAAALSNGNRLECSTCLTPIPFHDMRWEALK